MKKDLTKRTLKGIAWMGGVSVGRIGLKFVSVAILARILGPADYGLVAGAFIAADLAIMLSALGLTTALVQRHDLRPDHVSTALSVALAVSVVFALGLWLAAPAIAGLMQMEKLAPVVRWFALIVPCRAVGGITAALLSRHMRMQAVALVPFASWSFATFGIAIPLAFAGAGYWALVIMNVAESVTAAILGGVYARDYLAWPKFSRRAFRELLPMSLGFSLILPFNYVSNNADRFLIGRLLGADMLGLYTRASFLTTTTASLFNNIARTVVFPAMAQIQHDKERLRTALLKGLSLTALVTIPVSAFYAMFAKEIIDLLLGPQWGAAVIPFMLFSATLYLRLGRRSCTSMFQALGRPYTILIISVASAPAILIGTFVTVPYGLNAVCAVVALVMTAAFFIMLGLAHKAADVKISALLHVHAAPLVLGAGVLTIGASVKTMLAGMPSFVVLASGLGAIALPALALLYFRPNFILGRWGSEVLSLLAKPIASKLSLPIFAAKRKNG